VGQRQSVLVTEESFDTQYYVAHNRFYEQREKERGFTQARSPGTREQEGIADRFLLNTTSNFKRDC
ncbi:threonylcarbamoyladenosine tRNA methylthiotransferase, partial [Tachysurus ichikawai]